MEPDETLAPVTYLFGARASSARAVGEHDDPRDEDDEYDDLDDADTACADLTDAAAERQQREQTGVSEQATRRAENVAMHALTRRGLSRREVERVLRDRRLDEEAIAHELRRLEGVGLVDDMALAQNLVGTLQERKGLGRSAIAAELARRMLAPAAIEYALELIDSGDELARARELAVRRAPQLQSVDHATAVRRLSAYLARRGYGGSTVRTAVEHALGPSSGAGARGAGGGGVRFR